MADLKRKDMTKEEWRDYERGLIEPGTVRIIKLLDPADGTDDNELLGVADGSEYNPDWKPKPWG